MISTRLSASRSRPTQEPRSLHLSAQDRHLLLKEGQARCLLFSNWWCWDEIPQARSNPGNFIGFVPAYQGHYLKLVFTVMSKLHPSMLPLSTFQVTPLQGRGKRCSIFLVDPANQASRKTAEQMWQARFFAQAHAWLDPCCRAEERVTPIIHAREPSLQNLQSVRKMMIRFSICMSWRPVDLSGARSQLARRTREQDYLGTYKYPYSKQP